MADWIQNVDKEMEKKGTVGSFTKQATNAGMSVQDFAKKVKDNPTEFSERTRERAQFALNMQQIANKKKMEKGGKTDNPQGYNDKLNEDLGTRLGRESDYSQSLKDRRDESKAANKNLGRRAYSSVGTMDKGNRMFMQGGKMKYMEGGEMKYMEGGETQGYDDRDRESIGERNRGKKSQSLKSRMKESAGMEKSMGRRKYADVSTMDKGDRMFMEGGKTDDYSKWRISMDRFNEAMEKGDKAEMKKQSKIMDKVISKHSKLLAEKNYPKGVKPPEYEFEKGGYVYRESDDKDATEYLTKSEAMEFIDEHNEGFETNYKSIEDFNKGEQLANGVRSIEKRKMAKGGYVYRESDDEDATEYLTKSEAMEFIDEHNEGFETNYKSIEDFNKGEQLANGVRSIEKRKMARGGSVKGKIDRDRYVKLRREKDKEIAKLKKEKGALRKETITKDKCDDKIEKVEAKKVDNTEDNNNQTLLVGGIAGILLGAFFIGR